MSTLLKDGTTVEDPRLDRLLQFDDRSRGFGIMPQLPVAAHRRMRSYTWSLAFWLDQGREGRCVEFAICHEMLARPVLVLPQKVDEILANKSIYWPAQQRDVWPGGSYPGATPVYEGTSVLAGMQVSQELGFFGEYHWAFGLQEMVAAVGYHGPAVIGVNWYTGMYNVDREGLIHKTGKVAGGHAIVVRGVRVFKLPGRKHWAFEDLDLEASYFVLRNSWGKDWGAMGDCRISLADMGALLEEDGEVCLPGQRRFGSAD